MAAKTNSIIGGLDYDLTMIASRIPGPGESLPANEYTEALGGKGANSTIATYRSCQRKPTVPLNIEQCVSVHEQAIDDEEAINVVMVGAVGDDEYGKKLYTGMSKSGVDCSGIITLPNTQSSICFVMVDDSTRENRCLFIPGATTTWKKEHFLKVEELAHGIRPDLCVAQMEIHEEVVEQMIETAGRDGIDFCLNATPAKRIAKHVYPYITHLLVNESEAAIMSDRTLDEVNKDTWPIICQEFLDQRVKNVAITLGAEGAYYANATDRGHSLAYKVNVVDTTGAGYVVHVLLVYGTNNNLRDTFTGVYASNYLW